MEYGLIGAKLGHSFSKLIHEQLTAYTYDLCPLATPEQAEAFLRAKAFRAINVTIPYKELVMPFCDEIDAHARAIGAVNTIVNQGGRLIAHNTDFAGFLYMVRRHNVAFAGKTVMILGTGGTQKTVQAVAEHEGAARVLLVSRRKSPGALSYEEAAARTDVEIVVNTSPVGMFPHNGACLVDLACYPRLCAVFDVIYNPFETKLLWQAKQRGLPAVNGLLMLVAQAKYAAEYFLGKSIPDSEIDRVYRSLTADLANLVLIGMPSCGKTSLGRMCASALGKTFVDLDAQIEQRAQKTIPRIFAEDGEAAFRDWESSVVEDFSRQNKLVLSTGGGVVKRAENVRMLRQNGAVIYIDRPLSALSVGGNRPLSHSAAALAQMKAERAPLYEAAAHAVVHNNGSLQNALRQIKERFYEVLNLEWA